MINYLMPETIFTELWMIWAIIGGFCLLLTADVIVNYICDRFSRAYRLKKLQKLQDELKGGGE